MKYRSVVPALLIAAAACAKPAPPPPPPEPEPEPEVVVIEPTAPLPVRTLAGRYTLRTDLPRRTQRGRRATDPATVLRLNAAAARNPDELAGVPRQFVAAVAIPGYGGVARGRERAWWWPASGDSVVLHVILPSGGRMQLRGAVNRNQIRGDVWMISLESGSTYQLGTFTATRTR